MATKPNGANGMNDVIDDSEARIAAAAAAEALPELEDPAMPPEVAAAIAGAGGALAPAPAEPRPSALATPGVDLSDEIDSDDVLIPYVKLCQQMSKAAQDDEAPVRPGTFFYSLGNQSLGTSIRVIPLGYKRTRSYFQANEGLMCRSFDFTTGQGNPGGDCATCPLKDWPPKGQGGGPPCRIQYVYPVVVFGDDNDNEPLVGMIRLGGTSAEAAKTMNGIKKLYNKGWDEHTYLFNSQKQTNQRGQTYFVVSAKLLGKTTPEDLEIARRLGVVATPTNIDSSLEESDTE